MPDLMIVTMQQCEQLGKQIVEVQGSKGKTYILSNFGMGYDSWECTCPSYEFSRKPKSCKHVDKFLEERCSYHQQFDGAPEEDGVCPKCGGPTEYVSVGV